MKRFVSSAFLLAKKPIGLLRRISKDNFTLGLLLGAVFSLVVNIATVQLQEIIQKQHVLEAVENEILDSVLQANNVISSSSEYLKNYKTPNYFYTYLKYPDDLWVQSSEPRQYLSQIDPKIQIEVVSFYTVTLKLSNAMVDKISNLSTSKLGNCYIVDNLSSSELNNCKSWDIELHQEEFQTANMIKENGMKILMDYHPTYDRVNNPILRFLMGSNSMKILMDRK